ncbi:MAG: response regulator transcription factor [Chthoniobacteraceae bacterium]
MPEKIVVAEDEPDMLSLIASTLSREGYSVIKVSDGSAVLDVMDQMPQLIVLDLMMPRMSGLDVCRALKANTQTANIPIVMLTAKSAEVDRIVGFELGADDYISKPFSPRELVLRVKGILRRTACAGTERSFLSVNGIVLDRSRFEVTVNSKPVHLTATEFKLLRVLLERRGVVQSRAALLNDVWGYEYAIDTRTVDTHIRRVREKLGTAGECIETVRSFGYRIPK